MWQKFDRKCQSYCQEQQVFLFFCNRFSGIQTNLIYVFNSFSTNISTKFFFFINKQYRRHDTNSNILLSGMSGISKYCIFLVFVMNSMKAFLTFLFLSQAPVSFLEFPVLNCKKLKNYLQS